MTPAGMTGVFTYWGPDGTANSCDVAAPGVQLDIGLSDVFAETCLGSIAQFPSYLSDNLGPVQAMTPRRPQQLEREVDQRRGGLLGVRLRLLVAGAPVEPGGLDLPARARPGGRRAMIGAAIKVGAASWFGVVESSTSNMITALNGANGTAAAANTIGVLAAEDADANRATLHEPRLPALRSELRLPARLGEQQVRQDQRARRTLRDLGPDPPLPADRHRQPERRQPHHRLHDRHQGPSGRRPHPVRGDEPRHPSVRHAREAHPGDGPLPQERPHHHAVRLSTAEFQADTATSCTPCASAAQCLPGYSCPQFDNMGTMVGWCEPM